MLYLSPSARRSHASLLLAMALLLTASSTFARAQTDIPNLASNPFFEDGGLAPSFWAPFNASLGRSDIAHDGAFSARLAVQCAGAPSPDLAVPLPEGKTPVGGIVFDDRNDNGLRDEGELGL